MTDLLTSYLKKVKVQGNASSLHRARAFAGWLGDREPSPELVTEYVAVRQAEGYAPGSVNADFRVIRRMFMLADLPWAFSRGDAPKIGEQDLFTPSLAPEVIEKLIQVSRTLSIEHQAFLCLSTTYGMRRVELAEVKPTSFSWDSNLLFVETAKKGRQRYHMIAPEIRPILERNKWRRRSLSYLTKAFVQIKKAAGLVGPSWEEIGYHSIRRSLVILLDRSKALSDVQMDQFMRWHRSSSNMRQRYAASTEVGLEGARPLEAFQDEDLDREVFTLNPWLKLWEEV